jgi:hypothetical protein
VFLQDAMDEGFGKPQFGSQGPGAPPTQSFGRLAADRSDDLLFDGRLVSYWLAAALGILKATQAVMLKARPNLGHTIAVQIQFVGNTHIAPTLCS